MQNGLHVALSKHAACPRVGFFDMDELMVPALATQSISDVLADPTFVQSAAASVVFPRLVREQDGIRGHHACSLYCGSEVMCLAPACVPRAVVW